MKQKLFAKNMKKKFEILIENEILFNTSNDLEERFINLPYSKFGISIDYESAPMIGRWIGYKIVKSYLKLTIKLLKKF